MADDILLLHRYPDQHKIKVAINRAMHHTVLHPPPLTPSHLVGNIMIRIETLNFSNVLILCLLHMTFFLTIFAICEADLKNRGTRS